MSIQNLWNTCTPRRKDGCGCEGDVFRYGESLVDYMGRNGEKHT